MNLLNTIKKGVFASVVFSLTATFVGCSGSGGSPGGSSSVESVRDPDGTFTKIGHMELYKSPSRISIEADFISVKPGISQSTLSNNRLPGQDNCDVETLDGTLLIGTPPPNSADYVVTYLNAGEVLTLTSNAGTYVDLEKTPDTSETGYHPPFGQSLDGNFPAGLELNIPGDEYPAFTGVTVPDVERIEISSPASLSSITPDTEIKWIPTNNPNALVRISMEFGDRYVECSVIDDGDFVFPADVKASLDANATVGTFAFMERRVVTFVSKGDSLLMVTSYATPF